MKNKTIKGLLAFLLTLFLSIFAPLDQVEAAAKTGVVDLTSGVLNVRSGPGTNYKKIGSLKKNSKVTVYSIKSGWAQIKYSKKKGFVSDDYLRFYSTMPATTAKAIADKADKTQRVIWSKNYTKSQIYDIMTPQFTKPFIDKYFKQQFRTAGKDRKGNQLYHVIETEIWGLSLYPLDWKGV